MVVHSPAKMMKKPIGVFTPPTASATRQSAAIDTQGWRWLILAAISGVVDAGVVVTLTLEESTTGSGSWTAVANSPSISITDADDGTVENAVAIACASLTKRYVRVVATHSGSAGNASYPTLGLLFDPDDTERAADTWTTFGVPN